MAVDFLKLVKIPHIFKPVTLVFVLTLLMIYAADFNVAWWNWIAIILQSMAIAFLIIGVLMDYDVKLKKHWFLIDIVLSVICAIYCLSSFVILCHWLNKRKHAIDKSVFGAEVGFLVPLFIVHTSNAALNFMVWMKMNQVPQASQQQQHQQQQPHQPLAAKAPSSTVTPSAQQPTHEKKESRHERQPELSRQQDIEKQPSEDSYEAPPAPPGETVADV